MYKSWYIGTKYSDINIILSASRGNYSDFGFEKKPHGFDIHLWKIHIHYSKYDYEKTKGD